MEIVLEMALTSHFAARYGYFGRRAGNEKADS